MIVLVSGGFDPLHVGHLAMLKAARAYGPLWVGLNSDDWLIRKKGYFFMPFDERKQILEALYCVTGVVAVDDADGTVCKFIEQMNAGIVKVRYFVNGGDRVQPNAVEHTVCERLGIEELFGVGGGKVQSSSALVRRRLS